MTKSYFRISPSRRRRLFREKLMNRQDGKCHYCGVEMRLSKFASDSAPEVATFDHVVPRANGGIWHKTNIVLACRACNEAKAGRNAEDHFAAVKEKQEKAA